MKSAIPASLAEARKIVKLLAAWSEKYPRTAIYSYHSKDKIDGELIKLEEQAKAWVRRYQK